MMLCSPFTVFLTPGRTLLAALLGVRGVVLGREEMLITWVYMEMRVRRMAKAESKLEIGQAIHNVEVEGSMTSTSCPYLGDLLQAAENESLLCPAEGGVVGGVLDHLDDYLGGLMISRHFYLN